jgi:ATP-dependent Lon protease
MTKTNSNQPPNSDDTNTKGSTKGGKKDNKTPEKNPKLNSSNPMTPLAPVKPKPVPDVSIKNSPPQNTWLKFLDNLDKKYQPINPIEFISENNTSKDILKNTEIIKDKTEGIKSQEINLNLNLEIIENKSESNLTTPSEEDPDYTPSATETPSSSLCSSDIDNEETGEDEGEEGEETEEGEDEVKDLHKDLLNSEIGSILSKILFGQNNMSKGANGSSNPLVLLVQSTEEVESNDTTHKDRKRPANMSLTNDLKRQKMNSLDREYKAFLNTKEKDTYEYFCELDLDSKKRIITEEQIVKDLANDKEPIRFKVINSTLPSLIKCEIIRKLAASKCGFGGNPKLNDWVENVMRVPWSSYYPMPITLSDPPNKIGQYMTSIYNRMDMAVYGHNETKCHIMQIIGKWITNPSAVGNCLALQGPMGVGKTTLVKEGLAPALGRPFNFVSLGGATDASFLEGHSFTYEGSIPGQIVEVIQRSKCMNPIIYFDELDKISKSHKGEEIANLLIHITDTQQNDKFHDKYFGNIDIDLSKVFFVFSYNNDENVPVILKDRLQVVRVKGYNTLEKCKISKEYMFPRFCKDMGFKETDLIMNDDVINYIINSYADKEDGVRNLGRCLETLVSRINMLRLVQDSEPEEKDKFIDKLPFEAKKMSKITLPFNITQDVVENILIKPKVNASFHHMYL